MKNFPLRAAPAVGYRFRTHMLRLLDLPISKILLYFFVVYFSIMPGVVAAQAQGTEPQSSITSLNQSGVRGQGGLKPGQQNVQNNINSAADMLRGVNNVHVLGDVQNPGILKADVSDRAMDVLKYALPNRPTVRLIEIRRDGERTKTYDLYQYQYHGNLSQNPYLKDNDVIFVPKIGRVVRIEGPVTRPGVYELSGEKTLDSVAQLAGGFGSSLSKSYPIRVIRFDEMGKKNVIEVVIDRSEMKKFKVASGDIIIVPDKINSAKKFDYSVEAIPGENIVYPTSVPDVFVIGSVSAPGPYPYKSQFTIKDYLGFSGATADASFRSVVVIRDGEKKRKKLYESANAGDVIIVKQKGINEFLKYVGIASTLMSVTLSAIVLRDVVK